MPETADYKSLNVLLIIESCNPDWSSVPLVGYNFFREINQRVNATLVTHARNRDAMQKRGHQNVVYIEESRGIQLYFGLVGPIASKIWPLFHALTYPVYEEFNRRVYQQFKDSVVAGDYDLVHVITPMIPRYPVKLSQVCDRTPFLYGPVNGGVPFPKNFEAIARKEHAYLNFLRDLGELLLPGYEDTYRRADKILAGSTYTLDMLQEKFDLPSDRIHLFYENGIEQKFLDAAENRPVHDTIELIFVGRLVPYKGADMLVDAIAQLEPEVRDRIHLTIVGDGQERSPLEEQTQQLNLTSAITFTGWVQQQETLDYYRKSDLFCFPSIREFGGAVVMEAMACGLPCIVVNNGGIGEYVTAETGFKIEPLSRDHIVQEMAVHITQLVKDEALRRTMSKTATEQAKQFEWGQKALTMMAIYDELVSPSPVPKLDVATGS
jgi:glycosyltransferase involved in cell wall biosynthesis